MAVKIEKLIKNLNLEILVEGREDATINLSDINRPGLQFTGFYNYFANRRVQIVGNAEWSFLDAMNKPLRDKRLRKFFEFEMPCVIITRNLEPHDELIKNAIKENVWVLRTNMKSTRFINKLMNYLDEKLAPVTRVHGVLVDVYGIGILINGESGIGKSETALELVKRGHRLVADDAVEIKEIDGILKGEAPYITKGMLEVRGMGIIDVPTLYGLSSVLDQKTIDLIMTLEQWKENEDYDRLGTAEDYTEILNVKTRKIRVPIRPGRNVAVIIEAAAANYRYSITCKEKAIDIIERRMDENINEED